MRIVFMGTPDFAVPTLEKIIESGHEVVGVVTQPDKAKGRGHQVVFPPVKETALKYGLTVYQPKRVRDEAFVDQLKTLDPDVIVVVAFGQILPKAVLDLPPYGCVNVHASLLPKYRGAAPIQWAVINGEAYSGVTIMRMDEGLDTGDMIAREKIALPATRISPPAHRMPHAPTAAANILQKQSAKTHGRTPSSANGASVPKIYPPLRMGLPHAQ